MLRLYVKCIDKGEVWMNWRSILEEVISGSLLIIIGGILGWFGGLFKGKKISSKAVERKSEVYQPLLDELNKYSNMNWGITRVIKTPFLNEVVSNSYKYALDEEIQMKCEHLYETVYSYNSINIKRIAHSIIVDIFEEGYTQIYGGIVDGVVTHSNEWGDEWEEKIIAEPVQEIRRSNFDKEIESLLFNEGMYSEAVCVDYENNLYEPVYGELKRIYQYSLNIVINGQKYKKPSPKIEMNMSPEEYIAYNYDFFSLYNKNSEVKKKYELREEIIYSCQAIVQDLKDAIEKIVNKYEKEDI